MVIIETERLFLREMTEADAGNAYHLNIDPDVVKYTGDKAFESIEAARIFLANYDHYRIYGFGRWAVIDQSSDEFLGWCGLKYTKELDEFDIGFRFMKEYWNKGYATESAKACLDLGFNKFKMPEILGRAMKENIGSIRVLGKIGLEYLKPYSFRGQEGVLYSIKNKNLA
jgi:RimJ/RimL family protein N-acetyltransferase